MAGTLTVARNEGSTSTRHNFAKKSPFPPEDSDDEYDAVEKKRWFDYVSVYDFDTPQSIAKHVASLGEQHPRRPGRTWQPKLDSYMTVVICLLPPRSSSCPHARPPDLRLTPHAHALFAQPRLRRMRPPLGIRPHPPPPPHLALDRARSPSRATLTACVPARIIPAIAASVAHIHTVRRRDRPPAGYPHTPRHTYRIQPAARASPSYTLLPPSTPLHLPSSSSPHTYPMTMD